VRIWLLLLLALLACTPYLDHEQRLFEVRGELAAFGPKRQLELVSLTGDERSLLLVFNQPLRSPSDTRAEVPFPLDIHPPVEIADLNLEGAAGVRVTFAQPLPRAREYRLRIPQGWRTLTGVGLRHPIERRWRTALPRLTAVTVEGRSQTGLSGSGPLLLQEGEALELQFNQPVALGSVESALRWTPAQEEAGEAGSDPWSLEPVAQKDHTRFLFRPGTPWRSSGYRLRLGPGVKGLEGPLRGSEVREISVQLERPLVYTGPGTLTRSERLELEFSAPVEPEELARCLLTLPESSRPLSIEPHPRRPQRMILRFSEPLPSRLLLVAGLQGRHGQLLAEEVSLPLESPPPSKGELASDPLVPLPLAPGSHALVGGGGKTETWTLSLQQALAVSQTPEAKWTGRGALAWEERSPVFVANPQQTAQRYPVRDARTARAPYLLVKRTQKDGTVSRALLATSDLNLHCARTPEGVFVRVSQGSSGRPPQSGCSLLLRTATGQALGESVLSDSQGEALLPWPAEQERPQTVYVVATRGHGREQEQTFQPVGPVTSSSAALPSGFLTTDQPFYRPQQPMLVSGFLWAPATRPPDSEPARLVTRDQSGKVVSSVPLHWDQHGFCQVRCNAPGVTGVYTLSQTTQGDTQERTLATFRVCPVAHGGETYSLQMTEKGGRGQATLTRAGSRHRKVGLRASLWPLPEREQEPGGWSPLSGRGPRWLPLGSTSLSPTLDFALEHPALGGRLVVEAFDLEQPDLVLARQEKELPQSLPYLTLEFGPRELGAGQQALLPRVEGWSLGSPEISAELLLQSPLGWQQVERRANFRDGEPWELHLRRPGRYRLSLRATLPTGLVLEGVWERQLEPRQLPHPELLVEPRVAMPGATLTATVAGVPAGSTVWCELTGGGAWEGSFESVREDGTVTPRTLPFARALGVELITQWNRPPQWGSQRAVWDQRHSVVPLGPLSRSGLLAMSLERKDGLTGLPAPGQELRAWLSCEGSGEGWTGLLLGSPVLDGWPAPAPSLLESFLGRPLPLPSDSYPLLPLELPPGQAHGALLLGRPVEVEVKAPAEGATEWTALARDAVGRFAWTRATTKTSEVSRWRVVAPWGVREGDRFQAGPELICAPGEPAAVGATADAISEPGLQTPSGFLHTAGVTKPGQRLQLLFDYRLSSSNGEKVKLAWNRGQAGRLHRQEADLPVFETPPVPRGEGLANLRAHSTSRVRVPGPLPWRLQLFAPEAEQAEAAQLEVWGPQGSLGKISLRPGAPPRVLQGVGPGTVEIQHGAGPSITYQMFRLAPDTGQLPPWGERFYLFRSLLDEAGQSTGVAVRGASSRVRINLVNPGFLRTASVRLPLPGGLRPLSLAPLDGTTPEVSWRSLTGEVRFQLRDLPAGEFTWEMEVTAEAVGDYLWPSAQATGEGGELLAMSGSGRVAIVAR
jgi:hypothetical protein